MNQPSTRREFLEAAIVASVSFQLPSAVDGSNADTRQLARSALEQAIHQYERAWIASSDTGRETAIATFTRVIEIAPAFQLPYIYRGKCFYWSRDYHRAAADFSKAMLLHPSDEAGLAAWSYSYRAIREFDEQVGGRTAGIRHWLQISLRRAMKATAKRQDVNSDVRAAVFHRQNRLGKDRSTLWGDYHGVVQATKPATDEDAVRLAEELAL